MLPRNLYVEEVLEAAQNGDLNPFNELLAAVSNPYTHNDKYSPIPPSNCCYQTYCGT
jgi:uncharacterized protein YdiU (UPF0061 family)